MSLRFLTRLPRPESSAQTSLFFSSRRQQSTSATSIPVSTARASPGRGTGRRVARALLGAVGLTGAAVAVVVSVDEGSRRSAIFWKEALPKYLHYRWVDYRLKTASPEERDRAFNALHDAYAPRVEKLVYEMKGFYLKTAQLFSTADYFFPKQYLDFAKRTQSEVPSELKPGEARALVVKYLGLKSLEDVFSEFDDEPVGNASIGQVHRARLRSTNQLVAVKIQGQGLERQFRADIRTIISFCRLAMPEHVGPMIEMEKQFETEFDYRGEAKNLETVCRNVLPKWGDRVAIPRPILELCCKEILVMEFLEGKSLVKGIRESYRVYAESMGRTLESMEAEQTAKMKQPGFRFADVREDAAKIRRYEQLVRAKDAVWNAPAYVANTLFGRNWSYHRTPTPVNLGEMILLLCDVHGEEILLDGAFSGDPHPGNVLLMPDGRLGLIDMGQFKHIGDASRLHFARLIVAMANDDRAEVVRCLRRAGASSAKNNPTVTYRLASFWFDRNTQDVMQGKNIAEFLESMQAEDPAGKVPEDFVMIGRVSLMMRGLGNAFGLDLSTAKLWEPIARRALKEAGMKYEPKVSDPIEAGFTSQVVDP